MIIFFRSLHELFFLFLITANGIAQAYGSSETKIKPYYIVDDSSKYSVAEIIQLYKDGELKELNKGSGFLNLDFSASIVWIQFQVEDPEYEKILLIENAHLDYLYLFFLFQR